MLWNNLLHQGFLQAIAIYERYKTFLLNNVSFMALVSFQVNFIRAVHQDSKNEIEKHNIYNI